MGMKGPFVLVIASAFLRPKRKGRYEESLSLSDLSNKKQVHVLQEQLALCVELYNAALQSVEMLGGCVARVSRSRSRVRSCPTSSRYAQNTKASTRKSCKMSCIVLTKHSKPFSVVSKLGRRLAIHALSPGPLWKLDLPQFGFGLDEQSKLSLAKVGHLKLVMHRPFKGIVKTATITHRPLAMVCIFLLR